jgi:hypothetical protein
VRLRRAHRPLTALLAAAVAIGLAACGGGSIGPSTVAGTSTQATAAQVTTTTAPATTQPSRAKAAHKPAPRPASTTPGASSAPGGPSASASPTDGKASRRIIACLGGAGLVRPRLRSAGLWGGSNPVSGEPVLVDGPYKTRSAADTSAKSLAGVEYAERGGRYVASATLKSHLGAQVHQVARCLNASGTRTSLAF